MMHRFSTYLIVCFLLLQGGGAVQKVCVCVRGWGGGGRRLGVGMNAAGGGG